MAEEQIDISFKVNGVETAVKSVDELKKKVNDYFYEVEKEYFNRTTAYLISKKGAQKVLDYTKNSINVPIDDLFNMIYRLTLDFRYYVPADYYFKEQDNTVSIIKSFN